MGRRIQTYNIAMQVHFTLKTEAARSTETMVSYHIAKWCHNTIT